MHKDTSHLRLRLRVVHEGCVPVLRLSKVFRPGQCLSIALIGHYAFRWQPLLPMCPKRHRSAPNHQGTMEKPQMIWARPYMLVSWVKSAEDLLSLPSRRILFTGQAKRLSICYDLSPSSFTVLQHFWRTSIEVWLRTIGREELHVSPKLPNRGEAYTKVEGDPSLAKHIGIERS